MPLPTGMEAPVPVGDLIVYDPVSNDQVMFDKLSDKLKEKVKNSKEYRQTPEVQSENPAEGMESGLQNSNNNASGGDFIDSKDIPF